MRIKSRAESYHSGGQRGLDHEIITEVLRFACEPVLAPAMLLRAAQNTVKVWQTPPKIRFR
jgi:hypothetical protein